MEQRPWLVFFLKPQLRKYTQKKLHPTCYRKVYKVQLQLVSVFVRQNIKLCKMHFICTEFFFFRLPSSHFQHWLLWVLFLFFSKNINFVFRKRQHFNILLSWFSLCSVKALKHRNTCAGVLCLQCFVPGGWQPGWATQSSPKSLCSPLSSTELQRSL